MFPKITTRCTFECILEKKHQIFSVEWSKVFLTDEACVGLQEPDKIIILQFIQSWSNPVKNSKTYRQINASLTKRKSDYTFVGLQETYKIIFLKFNQFWNISVTAYWGEQ